MSSLYKRSLLQGCLNYVRSGIFNFKPNLNTQRLLSTSTLLNQIRNDDISLHIFDRNTKSLQRERAALANDVNLYDYLKDEIGYRLADRVFDIKRKFKLAANLGKILICCVFNISLSAASLLLVYF